MVEGNSCQAAREAVSWASDAVAAYLQVVQPHILSSLLVLLLCRCECEVRVCDRERVSVCVCVFVCAGGP